MKLYIKNMVCSRCKMVVKDVFGTTGLQPLAIDLGEIELETPPSKEQMAVLDASLKKMGFELIDDKKSRIIAQIKAAIIKWVHHSGKPAAENLSDYLAAHLHYEYTYVSSLFSEVEGTTIEKYFISQKIERAKELLVYDELSLSEIADTLGYSSSAYLSGQFKKITGLTPSYYKSLKDHKRKNIEDL